MNKYTAVVAHNALIVTLTIVVLIVSDGNLWSLLCLLFLCMAKGKSND